MPGARPSTQSQDRFAAQRPYYGRGAQILQLSTSFWQNPLFNKWDLGERVLSVQRENTFDRHVTPTHPPIRETRPFPVEGGNAPLVVSACVLLNACPAQ